MKDEGVGIHILESIKNDERIYKDGRYEFIDAGTASFITLLSSRDYDRVIFIDAIRANGAPGDVYKFNPEEIDCPPQENRLSAHDFNLLDGIRSLRISEPSMKEIAIYGIEPADISVGLDLSPVLKEKLSFITKKICEDMEKFYT